MSLRVRLAPSPTGNLHIGTARTALFNYLFARQKNGKFILRVEDTDKERSEKKYEKDITESLKWLGLDWDEGIDIGGPHAPYRQSERIGIYKKYLEDLLKRGRAFYCYHTKDELQEEKLNQRELGDPFRHICSHEPVMEAELADVPSPQRENYVIRLRRSDKKITIKDNIRGGVEFDASLLGNITLAKNTGEALYNFAVVIDDYEMEINYVLRGEDHLPNTPKQILIQEAFSWPRPEYAHFPLILGSDRSKMSKRHGATAVNEYKKAGYLPEALINFLVLLGWNPGTEQEIFNMEELIKNFSIERIQSSGAVFNEEKLNWINGKYLRAIPAEELAERCRPYLQETGLLDKNTPEKLITGAVKLNRERMEKFSDITALSEFLFRPPVYDKELLIWKKMKPEDLPDVLAKIKKILTDVHDDEFKKDALDHILKGFAEGRGDTGSVFWPLRVALSGLKASPGPTEIAEVLGKEETLARLDAAIRLIASDIAK